MSKPREFVLGHMEGHEHDGGDLFIVKSCEPKISFKEIIQGEIRVIEYSAYEALKEKLNTCHQEWLAYREHNENLRTKDRIIQAELAEAELEIDCLREMVRELTECNCPFETLPKDCPHKE